MSFSDVMKPRKEVLTGSGKSHMLLLVHHLAADIVMEACLSWRCLFLGLFLKGGNP